MIYKSKLLQKYLIISFYSWYIHNKTINSCIKILLRGTQIKYKHIFVLLSELIRFYTSGGYVRSEYEVNINSI